VKISQIFPLEFFIFLICSDTTLQEVKEPLINSGTAAVSATCTLQFSQTPAGQDLVRCNIDSSALKKKYETHCTDIPIIEQSSENLVNVLSFMGRNILSSIDFMI
jgi:hypothetical protein